MSIPTNRSLRRKQAPHLRQLIQANGKRNTSLFRYIASLTIRLIPRAAIASSLLFILQCVYVICRTPRLPPPPFSGTDFPKEGLVVEYDGDVNKVKAEGCPESTGNRIDEFRLVLIGDSPVEGIGNNEHMHALCGQTAEAFAKRVCKSSDGNQYRYDRVRYWSFGKSGLTAHGIEEEMVPYLHSTTDHIQKSLGASLSNVQGSNQEPIMHAIVLLCGVNNVLSPSTPHSFAEEVSSLLVSIRSHPGLKRSPIIILGLPDFAKLPFLPSWPMGWLLGLKGRQMQCALERVVEETQLSDESNNESEEVKVIMAQIPEVQDLIGSRGYRRLDSSNVRGNVSSTKTPFISSFCHPLKRHLDHDIINPDSIRSLGISDFLCDDGFHPGKYGTIYIGSLIADAYSNSQK